MVLVILNKMTLVARILRRREIILVREMRVEGQTAQAAAAETPSNNFFRASVE